MKKITGRLIFGAVMLAAVFFMSAFLFPAGVQAIEVDDYEELKAILEDPTSSSVMTITITENMEITDQIIVVPNITTLTIDGSKPDGSTYTLDGGGTKSFLKVGSIDLTLQNITIKNCYGDDGTVIYADKPNTQITLTNSVFTNNFAEFGSGGVVYQEGGTDESPAESNTLIIEGCTFTGNGSEKNNGGVIYQGHYARLNVSDSSFTDNFSDGNGGAIFQGDDCRMVIENSTFEENISKYKSGGAVFQNERCSLEISGSEFSGNEAYYQGGAICQEKGAVMTVEDCQFKGNESEEGGAVYAPTKAEVTGTGSEKCLFSGNEAHSYGGALEYGQDLTVTGCTFEKNTAYAGGALASPWNRSFLNLNEEEESYYFTQEGLVGTVVVSDSSFTGNTADYGGAWYDSAGFKETDDQDTYVYYDEDEGKYYYLTQDALLPVVVVNPGGSETRYDEPGVPIYFDEACGNKITVSGTEFIDNTAKVHGGALFLNNLQTAVIKEGNDRNVFSGNKALNGNGGVIYNIGEGELTVSGSEFTKNSAGVTDAICYSDENGTVSFEDNTFTGNTVGSDDGWVFSLGGNTTITNNDFFANTDTKRDMLFKDASKDDEISGNTYRGNFLEDAFSSPAQGEIAYDTEIGVTLDLREVYNDKVQDGAVRISINGSTDKDFEVTDGKAVIKIDQSDLNDGVNNIKAEYISGEYTDEDEYTEGKGYYHYQQPELNFTITKYTVTVTTDRNGTASADPASGTTGTEAALTAEPNEGFKFKEWVVTESGGGTLNGDTFTIGTDDAEIEALFEAIEYQVTVTSGGNGTATAEPTSGKEGDKVKLTAKPDEGYHFKEWKVSGSGTLEGDTFTIGNGPAEIQAVFEKDKEPDIYTVTVTVVGNGTASANPTSGPTGTEVLLTAQPDDGWEFKEWNVIEPGGGTLQSQKATGASETAVFIIGTADAEIQAVFEETVPEEYQVTVTTDGNGTAAADPVSGLAGTNVTLTANPKEGYTFKEWRIIESGGGTLNGDSFTIGTGNAEIEAIFAKEPQPPVPPKPVWPSFFKLPQTGITGTGIPLKDKPASLNYAPAGMELYIPVLDIVSDIVTIPLTDDSYPVQWLGKDAGLLEGFAKPGSGISVIAGHNTLNDTDYGPFALLAALDLGDVLFVRRSDGELLRFTVYANEKIGAGDADALQKSALVYENTLTLLTCEDELPEGGYASRRIVSAKYID